MVRRSTPLTYSMTMKSDSSDSTRSNVCTMFAWSSVAEIFFSCSLVADAANVAREPRDEPDERGDLGRLLRHAGKQQAAEQVDAGMIAAFFVGCLL